MTDWLGVALIALDVAAVTVVVRMLFDSDTERAVTRARSRLVRYVEQREAD